jgi:hypothetical protein
MFQWLKKKEAPLTGAPEVRRQKTHSAESGYVYQYFYEGQRASVRGGYSGIQFVFDVSADRKTSFPGSVFVSDASVEHWERDHGRSLTSTERYAIAKLALFAAFDRCAEPAAMHDEVIVGSAEVDEFLERLSID